MQIELALFTDTAIPEAHLRALLICNSADNWVYKHQFYKIKTLILLKYGKVDGYDLQTIKKGCYSCNGKGIYKSSYKLPETCWNCFGTGIYKEKHVVLSRFILNGHLFHCPVGELTGGKIRVNADEGSYYYKFEGTITNNIHGLIKHQPIKGNATWWFYYLLWHYDISLFYKRIESDVKSYQRRYRNRLSELMRKHNPLKVFADFFKIKKQELDSIDDLPF